MVWRHDHAHNDNNDADRRNRSSERTPILVSRLLKRAGPLLTERQVCLNPGDICVVHARCLAQMALSLCTFCRQQVTSRRMRSQHFATRRDLEAFCYGFTGFTASDWLWHEARKIIRACAMTNCLLCGVCVRRRNWRFTEWSRRAT